MLEEQVGGPPLNPAEMGMPDPSQCRGDRAYMHGGVFKDLATVVRFYSTHNSLADAAQANPETGQPFGFPSVPETLAVKKLTHGPALDDRRVEAHIAFLNTLIDARYEPLLER